MGLNGFYPFDLMAAAYARNPAHFRRARVRGWVAPDPILRWFDRRPTLLVTQADGEPATSSPRTEVKYCDFVDVTVDELFR